MSPRGAVRRAACSAGIALALGAGAVARAAAAEPERPAARFLDSIGVVTHAPYADTAYADWDRAVAAVRRLGIRHVRDALSPGGTVQDTVATQRHQRALRAAVAAGLRFDFVLAPPADGRSVAEQLAPLRGPLRGAAESVEGLNEPDVRGGDWVRTTREVQGELFLRVKSDPTLRGVTVLGPSLVAPASRAALGDLSGALDAGNVHPYTGAGAPAQAGLAAEAQLASAVSGTKPLWATEAGFHDALRATAGQPPASERAAATYLLRTFLEHFDAGIVRTFAYELLDERADPGRAAPEEHFGLLRHDFSPKPAFRALAALVEALRPLPGAPGPARTAPTSVDAPSGVGRVLLRRGPAEHALVLWRDASVWDRDARRDLAVAPVTVRVRSAGMTGVAEVRPLDGRRARPLEARSGGVRLPVGGDPVVLTWRSGPVAPGSGGWSTGTLAGLTALVAAAVALAALLARRRTAA